MSRQILAIAVQLMAVMFAVLPAPRPVAATGTGTGIGIEMVERCLVAPSFCGLQAGVATSTFAFDAIPPSSGEIGNPWRGAYEWQRAQAGPPGWPATDNYVRFRWSNLERERGTYTWMDLDAQLEKARARGGKLGLRIVALNSTDCAGSAIPPYLMEAMPRGSWFYYEGCRPDQRLYLPDWNHEAFLSRSEALIRALAARYGDDPRLGWIEIGIYGDWGEWHLWKVPNGAGAITDENARRLVDAHVTAFPTKRIIAMKDHAHAFGYALGLSPSIGWRNDCLGDEWFARGMSDRFAQFPWAADRWKTAPILTETCYERPGTGGFARAAEQVRAYRVAMIGQGNMEPWDRFSQDEQRKWMDAVTAAGYRLAPMSITVPSTLVVGVQHAIDVTWRNDGATPAYHQRRARFSLVEPATGAAVWEGDSTHDVGVILPGTETRTDTFTLPSEIAPGAYELVLAVVDPHGYHPPLGLAIEGRRADGSYTVGSVVVGAP